MQKRIFLLLICFLSLTAFTDAAENKIKIGKVDLGLLVSLHPKMALFDFDRMGFFKLPAGLSQEEFEAQLAELKSAPGSADFENQRQQIRQEISRIERTKAELLEKFSGASTEFGAKIERDLIYLSKEYLALEGRLADVDYQENCRDLTSPSETRKILDEIESQVMTQIKNLARDKGYELIFNSSITVPFNYPVRYQSGNFYGLGVPGIDYSLFYSFLANRDHALKTDEIPQSRNLINWLELINYPPALNLLPLKPYPIVLSGGDDLTIELIRNIYAEFKIDSKVVDTLTSVLEIVLKHDKRFDTNLESLVGPK